VKILNEKLPTRGQVHSIVVYLSTDPVYRISWR